VFISLRLFPLAPLRETNIFDQVILKSILYFVIVSGFIEGIFIYYFLKNRKYIFAVLQSLLVNGFSLFVSLKVWPFIFPTGFDFADLTLPVYSLLWLAAVVAEAFLLKVFYRRTDWKRIIMTSLVMNLAAYTILYLLFVYINR
jgi:hypothetical protein